MKPSSSDKGTMDIITLDVETTMADMNPKRSSSNPYYTPNRLVMAGAKNTKSDKSSITCVKPGQTVTIDADFVHEGEDGTFDFMLVGHNIKFDINWCRRYFKSEDQYNSWMNACRVWDTQIADYIMSGQQNTFTKLDDLAARLLNKMKDDVEFMEPLGADGIDHTDLKEYLKKDLSLTEEIALIQMAECTDEQFNLIVEMGDALKATADMEFNGMHVDEDMLIDKLARVGLAQVETASRLSGHLSNPDLVTAKPEWYNSNQVLSCMIFGGTVSYNKREANGLFKTGKRKGQVRYKNVAMEQKFSGFVHPGSIGAKKSKAKTKAGEDLYSVDEDTLQRLEKNIIMSASEKQMLDDVMRMRALKKVAGTYYENLLVMHIEGIVHHSLHHTATATGRLSSSQPNLQNIPMPDEEDSLLNVKECFTSRYGDEGLMLEVDFKQLEVCALAWLTKDAQLIEDITNGRDIHMEIAKELGLDTKDKRIRRDVKTIVFAMIYGSGWKGIVKSSGLAEPLVKGVIRTFYSRYRMVKPFYDELTDEITLSPVYDKIHRDKDGNPQPMYEWVSPTGRKYMMEQDMFRNGPSYTQTRNYPVQGTATGDIVPVVLGEIGSVLRNAGGEGKVCMVSTTHDSVTFDCQNYEVMKELIWKLEHNIFNDINSIINARLPGIGWDVPLVVEYEAGPNWGALETLDKTRL